MVAEGRQSSQELSARERWIDSKTGRAKIDKTHILKADFPNRDGQTMVAEGRQGSQELSTPAQRFFAKEKFSIRKDMDKMLEIKTK